MKRRASFVANSSSSSFICEICAETVVSWDGPEGMVNCVNDHLICDEHRLNNDESDCDHKCDDCDNSNCGSNVIPESACPICQFQIYSQPEMKSYLFETYGIDPAVVFAEIKLINKRRKKLYNEEYITHVLREQKLTDELVLDELKTKFGTYKAFRNRNRTVTDEA